MNFSFDVIQLRVPIKITHTKTYNHIKYRYNCFQEQTLTLQLHRLKFIYKFYNTKDNFTNGEGKFNFKCGF